MYPIICRDREFPLAGPSGERGCQFECVRPTVIGGKTPMPSGGRHLRAVDKEIRKSRSSRRQDRPARDDRLDQT